MKKIQILGIGMLAAMVVGVIVLFIMATGTSSSSGSTEEHPGQNQTVQTSENNRETVTIRSDTTSTDSGPEEESMAIDTTLERITFE